MAVKRILRYVAGTSYYGLRYRWKTGKTWLIGYIDSDLAGDIDTRKSRSGTMFFLGSSLMSWQSLKQRVVALSCEAEYVAATSASTQGLWLAWLLGKHSKSALALAKPGPP